MLKVFGAVLIIVATTLGGFYFARQLQQRTEQIRQLQMVLQMLETEIFYGSTPLEIAFTKLGEKDRSVIGRLFARCTYYLTCSDGASTQESWEQALAELKPKLALKPFEIEWLRHFGYMVGNSDRLDQQKHIQLLQSHLHNSEVEARDEQLRYEKMYKTLGVLTGLIIVILMV